MKSKAPRNQQGAVSLRQAWLILLSRESLTALAGVLWILVPFVPTRISNILSNLSIVIVLSLMAVTVMKRRSSLTRYRRVGQNRGLAWQAVMETTANAYVQAKPNAVVVVGILRQNLREVHVFRNGTAMSHVPPERMVFEIGSITKVFTSALLADMVLRDEVHLDDPISTHLPSVMDETAPASKITLVQLATHTSGLPRLAPKTAFSAILAGQVNPYRGYTKHDLQRFLVRYRGTRGRRFDGGRYSNLGMDLLGHVLSTRLNQSYECAIRERVCHPLGLQDTVVTLDDDQASRLAVGHLTNSRKASNWDFQLGGAGSLYSTVHDLLTFLSANLGHTESGIEESLRLCHRTRVSSLHGQPGGIGLNWLVHPTGITWHNGGTGGYRSFVGFSADEDLGVVVLSNYADEVDSIGFGVLTAMMRQAKESKEMYCSAPDKALSERIHGRLGEAYMNVQEADMATSPLRSPSSGRKERCSDSGLDEPDATGRDGDWQP